MRAEEIEAVVVKTISIEALRAALDDIDGGDGGERKWKIRADGSRQRPKLHSAYSSCGLALNFVRPWRLDPSSLVVANHAGFDALTFEQQLRVFRGGRAPNVDVFLTTAGRALAIESKLTEHLNRKAPAKFSDAYERLKQSADATWWSMFQHLKQAPATFKFLDAAQLVKHYFGLKTSCKKQGITDATLLYLYWEPGDPDRHPEFADHAREVEEFKRAVSDPVVTFQAFGLPELWASWFELREPAWLHDHVIALRERYAFSLA